MKEFLSVLSQIVSTSPCCIMWRDSSLNFKNCSEPLAKILRLQNPSQIIGKSECDLPFCESIQLTNRDQDLEILNTGSSFLDVKINIVGDSKGDEKYLLASKTPIKLGGRIVGVLYNCIDVTEEEKSDKNFTVRDNFISKFLESPKRNGSKTSYEEDPRSYIKALMHYYDSILGCMPGNVYWLNRDCVLMGGNDNLAKVFGLDSSSDLIGLTYDDMKRMANWTEGQGEAFRAVEKKVMETGKARLAIEEPPIIVNGEERFYLGNKVPIYSNGGDCIGVVGVSIDVTENKRISEKLKEESKKSAVANKAKSEFIANMSHDLRTPMTGVMGMLTEIGCLTEDILKTPAKAVEFAQDMAEYVKVGKDSTDQLLSLFNEILETVKLGSGQIRAEDVNFSLNRRINATLNLLRATAEDRSLEIKKALSPDLPVYFLGARHSLDRILANLVSNALKFTKEGHVEVSAELASAGTTEVGNEVRVRVCVSDTGIGIPKDKQESIFEHFSRINPSYEGNYKGNGLGLYAVKQYVESMNGSISVESEEGKGSKFIVELPFKVSDHSDQEEAVEPLPPLPSTDSGKSPEPIRQDATQQEKETPAWHTSDDEPSEETVARVLVVEDNFAAAMSIQRALKRLSCAADHAKTGEESVDFAKSNQYDIVFMDIGLPGINGFDATKQIRAFSSVPIIAVTGHVDKAGDCIDAGMQELLAKPATPSSLEAMLNRHVHSKSESIQKLNDAHTIIDFSCSRRMHDNDDEVTREILDHVYDELIESEKIIDAAYAQKNVRRLRDEIHKVKGGVCYLRLPQLERALNDFHLTLREDPIVPENMDKEYQSLKLAIKNFKEAYEKGDYAKNLGD